MTPYFSSASQIVIDHLKQELGQGILLHGQPGIGLYHAATYIARTHTKEVITVQPDAKGTISIDAVRELYTLGRSKSKHTIIIIDDADAMGREAQNALLKLLEEPIASLHFIITSHAPEQLLQTIRSRVQHYGLTPITTDQSLELIQALHVTDHTKRAQLLFIAEGLPAALTRYATDDTLFSARSLTVRDARSFMQSSKEDRLLMSAGYKDRAQTLGLIRDMMKLLRRSAETNPKAETSASFDMLLATEAALVENASVRLSLTNLAVML